MLSSQTNVTCLPMASQEAWLKGGNVFSIRSKQPWRYSIVSSGWQQHPQATTGLLWLRLQAEKPTTRCGKDESASYILRETRTHMPWGQRLSTLSFGEEKNVSAEWAYILFLSNKTEPIREMWQGAGRMCNASQFGAGVTWNSKQLPGPTPSFHQEENDKRIIEAKIFVHMKVAAGFDLESGSVSFFFPFFFS